MTVLPTARPAVRGARQTVSVLGSANDAMTSD